MQGTFEFYEEAVEKEKRKRNPVSYALRKVAIVVMSGWCLLIGAAALVGFLSK